MSNRDLPPGCSSPDGGIDHEYEAALEAFMEIATYSDEVRIANAVLPAILDAVRDARKSGYDEGKADAQQEADENQRRAER